MKTYKNIKLFLLAALGGFLYAAAFPIKGFPSFAPGAIVGISLFLYSTSIFQQEISLKNQFINLMGFSITYNLLGYYWIPHTIGVFGDIPFPLNYIIGQAFSLIITPQYFIFIVLLAATKALKKVNLPKIHFLSLALGQFKTNNFKLLGPAILLTLLEFFTPQQFPAHTAHPWLHIAPYLGLAPVFGPLIFSFFSFWSALALALFLKEKQINYPATAGLIVFIAINFFYPLKKWPTTTSLLNHNNQKKMPQLTSLNVRFVQADITTAIKKKMLPMNANFFEETEKIFHMLSVQNSKKKIDLIIWPETAYPRVLSSRMMKISEKYIPQVIKNVIDNTKAAVFFGGYDQTASNVYQTQVGKEYNSAFFVDQKGQFSNSYNKIKLIPFGEDLPFGALNKYIAPHIKNISFFARGNTFSLFHIPEKQLYFTAAICYEILFSDFIRFYLQNTTYQPSFIINLTKDSWYGDTSEPRQHLFLAKWRALEFGIPILRMTNTGITSILYPDGSEGQRLKYGSIDILDQNLLLPKKPSITFYQKWGLLPILGLWITIILLILGQAILTKTFFPKIVDS